MDFSRILSGLCIGLGIFLASQPLAKSLDNFIATKKTVVVKGLSEKEVKADLAIWPITVKEVGNDLVALQTKIVFDKKTISDYLTELGFEKDEIVESPVSVIDHFSDDYNNSPRFRYAIQLTISLRTQKVDVAKKAMEGTGKLISQGIVILPPQYENGIEFSYTALNEIKPDMIREATEAARQAAEQFAKDSTSKVGTIKSAQQGQFSIIDRDKGSPDYKIVRVVNTMEYFLN